jgi:FMN phosphatase YigB (HAD superfamily)
VAAEKPNPMIFLKACDFLGVKPEAAVHVGDDRRNDIWGARDAGCDAWLWGSDVHSFKEVLFLVILYEYYYHQFCRFRSRLLVSFFFDSLSSRICYLGKSFVARR